MKNQPLQKVDTLAQMLHLIKQIDHQRRTRPIYS
jgi:hypothetical protein